MEDISQNLMQRINQFIDEAMAQAVRFCPQGHHVEIEWSQLNESITGYDPKLRFRFVPEDKNCTVLRNWWLTKQIGWPHATPAPPDAARAYFGHPIDLREISKAEIERAVSLFKQVTRGGTTVATLVADVQQFIKDYS